MTRTSDSTILRLFNKISKFCSYLMTILLIVLITVAIGVKFNKLDSFLGFDFWTVLTESMTPKIPAGSLVTTKEVNPKNLKVGDAITFSEEDQTILTHRIVKIVENDDGSLKFQTKGDANNIEDPGFVESSEIKGQYVFHIPFLGEFLLIAQTPRGNIASVLTILLIFTTIQFIKILWSEEEKSVYEMMIRPKMELMIIEKKY